MSEQTERKTLKQRFFRETLSTDQRTLLGTVIIFAIILAVVWVGINEQTRMETFAKQYEARSIQRGASVFHDNCTECHGQDGKGLPGIAPALNAVDLFDGTRLATYGWTGTLEEYVELTVAAGRPVKSDPAWPNPMPTWSQEYGGPMRPDQVRDVAAYVLNYSKFYEEGGEVAAAGAGLQPTPIPKPSVTTEELIDVANRIADGTLVGDPAHGEKLYSGEEMALDGAPMTCNACHTLDGSTLVGPSYQGINGRLPHPDYTAPDGATDPVIYYLVESIWSPDMYKVPGFEAAAMTANFYDRMTEQDLADTIAFLKSLE